MPSTSSPPPDPPVSRLACPGSIAGSGVRAGTVGSATMRPGTTIVLALLLIAIFGAALVQFLLAR